MNKKYELTSETKEFKGHTLYRIKALADFGLIKKGELGGWIESEKNLSQEGNAWILDDAMVFGNACVYENAWVCENAQISDNVGVFGKSYIGENALICENAQIFGLARIDGNVTISGNAQIVNAWLYGDASVYGDAKILGDAHIYGNASIYGDAKILGYVTINGNAKICANAKIETEEDFATVKCFGAEKKNATFFRCADGGIKVKYGFFIGDLDEFRKEAKEMEDDKITKEHMLIADLTEYHFRGEK